MKKIGITGSLASGITSVYQNKTPFYEIVSGASIAFAAILLIVPGFFTDLIGFLLLFPFTRNLLLKNSFKIKKSNKEKKEGDNTIDGEIVHKDKDEL